MIAGLPPSFGYKSGLFRLAGFGGALVILRSGVVPGDEGPAVTLDVGFLTPTDYAWFLRRPMTAGLSQRLSDFFFACANEFQPQAVLVPVVDDLSGLDVRVLSSTDSQVELEIQMVDEHDDSDGLGGLRFMTSRVGSMLAAEQVRVLEAAGDWDED